MMIFNISGDQFGKYIHTVYGVGDGLGMGVVIMFTELLAVDVTALTALFNKI